MVHKQIIIKGKVENTGFRFHALRGAYACNITGVVSQKDGNIIIEAEGEPDALEEFVTWCSKGSIFSRVSSVDVIGKDIYGYADFKIS